jgi:hypothetical protein
MNTVIIPSHESVQASLTTVTIPSQTLEVNLVKLIGGLYAKLELLERRLTTKIDTLEQRVQQLLIKNKSISTIDGES